MSDAPRVDGDRERHGRDRVTVEMAALSLIVLAVVLTTYAAYWAAIPAGLFWTGLEAAALAFIIGSDS